MPAFMYRLPVRIYALALLALVMTAGLTVLILTQVTQNAYAMRKAELHNVTDAAISLLHDLEQGWRMAASPRRRRVTSAASA